jgi:hypothetical protein
MSSAPAIEKRVLSIDPTHRGFGYVVLEGSEHLIDWGVRHVQGSKNKASIQAASDLMSFYRPQILVLEDISSKNCRKRKRVRDLIEALDQLGRSRGISVRKIVQTKIKRTLSVSNKAQMARTISVRFPELRSRLPPERKPWMSEPLTMAIFDAAAFAIAFFDRANTNRVRPVR